MSVKKENQEILVCRICLASDIKLYNMQESRLLGVFVDLLGTQERYGLRRVCSMCRAQLARACALQTRARRAHALLAAAFKDTSLQTMDYIRAIDRVAEQLCLNLKTCHIYSSDSTLQDVKEEVKEESDFTENIFVSEPSLADYEDFREITPEYNCDNVGEITKENIQINCHNKLNINKIEVNKTKKRKVLHTNKIKIMKSTKETDQSTKRSKKLLETTKDIPESIKETHQSTKRSKKLLETTKDIPESTKETKIPQKGKRVIKRRMADNGYLPDFNFEEFENKYNVKIDILTKEEQMREIEARKMAPSYALAAFGCDVCGKGFATKQVYEAHMMKHDASWGAHACAVCALRFSTRSRAHVHADAHRLRFTCRACAFLTRTRFIAKNHFLSHSGSTHRCPHCAAVFTKYTSYLTHVRRRHPAMNVACDQCGETFVGHNGLRHHKTRVHRNDYTSCLTHVRRPAINVVCDWCGETFVGHNRNHHSKPRADVPCRDCSQTFADQASYDTHYQRIHLNIGMKEPPRARSKNARAFICELCGAECTSLSTLAAHQRAHGGARPHACPAPACARAFSTLHNMRRHHRVVHLGRRPQATCGVCGKLLAHAASLKLHVNTVHLKLPAPRRRRDKQDRVHLASQPDMAS